MRRFLFGRNRFFIIGMTSGVILSLVVMPFLEECHAPQDTWYSHVVNNDYDPMVGVHPKPANVSNKNLDRSQLHKNRPRFYTTELGVKQNLLICILTNRSTFDTMATAINMTLAQVADKTIFLMESMSSSQEDKFSLKESKFSSQNSLLFIPVPKTDSVPFSLQPKFLQILKLLFSEKYVYDYNFIFMVSDRTYVKADHLADFVSTLSMSESVFVTPHVLNNNARSSSFDVGSSSFDDVLQFGVLLSCTLLLKCNINEKCLNKYQNTFLGVSQPNFFAYHYEKNDFNQNELNVNQDLFKKAISVFPMSSPEMHFELHLLWCQYSLNESLKQLDRIEQQIIESNAEEPLVSWPVGVDPPYKATNRFDVIRWSYFNESHSFMPNDFDVISPLNDLQSQEIHQIKSLCAEWLKRKYYRFVNEDTMKIINFYKRFDAMRGLEYIIDVRLRAYPDTKRLQILRPLNNMELIPGVPYVTENIRIVMVLTIRGEEEIESASSFLNQYAAVCLKKSNHQTVVLLILITQPNDDRDIYGHIKIQATQLQSKFKNTGAKIAWIPVSSAKEKKVPSELALIDLLSRRLSVSFSDSLILYCRTNMLLSVDFLNRVRLNTILGYQVFFPIPFVEYRLRSQVKPLKNFDVRKDNGYFDTTNFNHGSFYLSDFLKARKVTREKLPIVKSEQDLMKDDYYDTFMDLHNLFVAYNDAIKRITKSNALFIMRAIEPELKLKHEGFHYDCDYFESNVFAKENCQKRNLIGLGSKQQLAALIIDDDKHDALEMDDDNNDAF